VTHYRHIRTAVLEREDADLHESRIESV